MAHEEVVYQLMESLAIASKQEIGDIMATKKIWTAGPSTFNNSYKALCALTDIGKLIKGDGYFKLPSCKSEYKEHSQLITKALAEVLKLEVQSTIFREITIPEVGLRPDAICLLTKNNQGYCMILEVCNNETPEYLQSKINVWDNWQGDAQFLSQLFKYKIPHYEVVPVTVLDGFKDYLQEVTK
ncbi:MAG: hypothetical protein WC853_09045 [Thermodesulfovibrionales bacterium]